MSVDYFTNDRYKVLKCMYERQIEVAGNIYVPLSQRQISDITGLAYKTVNAIIKYLREDGYISFEGTTRGKYILTDKAKAVIIQMTHVGDGGNSDVQN